MLTTLMGRCLGWAFSEPKAIYFFFAFWLNLILNLLISFCLNQFEFLGHVVDGDDDDVRQLIVFNDHERAIDILHINYNTFRWSLVNGQTTFFCSVFLGVFFFQSDCIRII